MIPTGRWSRTISFTWHGGSWPKKLGPPGPLQHVLLKSLRSGDKQVHLQLPSDSGTLRFSSTAPHPDRRTLSSSCGILKVSVISAPKTRCGWEREGASIVDEASHWTNRFRVFWKDGVLGVLFPRRPFRVDPPLRCQSIIPTSLPNPWPLATSNWDTRTSATFHKSESYRKLEEDAMDRMTKWSHE